MPPATACDHHESPSVRLVSVSLPSRYSPASCAPMQNGYVEAFNRRMRDELLNETLFGHARAVIREWQRPEKPGRTWAS